jgi:hypothetical protein
MRIFQFLLFRLKVFLDLAQIVLKSLVFIPLHLKAVAEVNDCQLSLVLGIDIFDAFILTIIQL